MIPFFIFIMLSINKVASLCTQNQTYWQDTSTSVKTQQLALTDVQTLKLGLGFWINYQPLNGANLPQNFDANYQSAISQQFLFALKQKYSEEYIMYNYVEIIPDQSIIQHVTLISTENQWLRDNSVMNNQYYEGNWILIFFFIDQIAQNVKIQYYFPIQSSLIESTLNGKLKVDQNMITITGSYLNIQLPQKIYLQSFTGLILAVFKTNYNIFDNIQQYFKTCPIQVTCSQFTQYLIDNNFALTGTQFISRQSNYFVAKNKYLIKGWIKQNALLKETQLVSLLLRITTNKLYLDETQAGDRVLYILYYQNQIQEQLNGFSIQTYGYTFPYKPSLYSTDQSDIIDVRGVQYQVLLTQWHYFQFEIGTQTNQGQPTYQVKFPSENKLLNLTWSKPKNQFSNVNLYMSIGGDNYFSNNFKGYLSDWSFKYFCNSPSTSFQLLCHYSCLTCKGISSLDCQSCGDNQNRIFSATENICYCRIGYYDVDGEPICQKFDDGNSVVQIKEKEISCLKEGFYQCDPRICQFGYFPYKDDCVKCPFYDSQNNQETTIECADCYMYPESFSFHLTCKIKFNSPDSESVYFYSKGDLKKSSQLYSIFQNIDKKYELKVEKGASDINICLEGYYLDQGRCSACIMGCRQCENQNTCGRCFNEYGLTIEGFCKLCQNCILCQFKNQTEYCPYLMSQSCLQNQYYENKYCYDCGNNCRECPKKYCQSCIDEPQYFISIDNFNCLKCTIPHCKYCFQYHYLNDGTLITTLNFGASYNLTEFLVKTGCALCEENYFFSFITLQCIQVQSECQSGVITEQGTSICLKSQTKSDAIQQNLCSNIYCKSCINNYSYQIQSFCILCMDGFYSAYLTGQCLQCPSNCKTCAEQNSGSQDAWKWEIRAFYQYLQNQDGYHPFEQGNRDSNNFEVVCLSCYSTDILYKGKCREGCRADCLDCRIIIRQPFNSLDVKCYKCKSSIYSLQRSTVRDPYPEDIINCLQCPIFCSGCYPRTSEEIKKINPFFKQQSAFLKYTHICYKPQTSNEGYVSVIPSLLVPIACTQYEKCQKSIHFTYYVYCDPMIVYKEKKKEPDINLQDRYTSFEAIFEYGYADDIRYIQDSLNQQRITEATYHFDLRFVEDYSICYYQVTPNFIMTILQEDIFSVQQTNLIIYTSFTLKTPFMLQNEISMINYNLIKFQNISFIMPSNTYDELFATLLILNDFYMISIILEDCEFTQPYHQFDVRFTFYSNKSSNLTLKNILFESLLIKDSIFFDTTLSTEHSNSKLSVQFLIINNSNFTNTCMFNFIPQSLDYQIYISNVTIENSFFVGSQFINSSFENQNDIGSFYLENFYLRNVVFSNSSIFLNILSVNNLTIKNFTLNNLVFKDYSSFLISNVIDINTFIFINSYINFGFLISNSIKKQLSDKVKGNSQNVSLLNLIFRNNTYINENSYILLVQDQVDNLNVKLYNLHLDDNNYQNSQAGIQSFNYLSYKNSLIYIECTKCDLFNITILRGIGLPEISIVKSNYLKIVNLQIHLKDKYYFRSLHQSFECIKQFIQFDVPFAIYIEQYMEVFMQDIILHDSIIVNYPFIQIVGNSLTQSIQNDVISISDSIFSNNVLIITEANKISSLIYISTQQNTQIEIRNVSFVNNIMNVYYEDIKLHAASTLLLDVQSSDIKVKDSQFLQNVITNSSDSILFIKTENLTISNCTFLNSNNFSTQVLSQKIILPITNNYVDEGTLIFFPILSEGGNGNLFVSYLKIENTSLMNSSAINGGGFFITLQDKGQIHIKDSVFENLVTILDGSQISSGGTLYIDSSKSKLHISIINSKIKTSYSRTMGGAIFIDPSRLDNYIYLDNMTITSVFSLQHSILSYSPSKLISATSNVIIQNTIIENKKENFDIFVSQISGLTQQNIEPFQKSNPLIFLQFSNFTMRNCTFQNIHLGNLVQVDQGIFIELFKVNVLNCTILKTPIITLSLRQNIKGLITLKNIVIQRISEFTYIKSSDDCAINEIINSNDMMCPLINQVAQSLIISSIQLNLTSQLECTLNDLYDVTDTNFSLIYINNMEEYHYLSTLNVLLSEILCPSCYFGLFSIQQFNFTQLSLRLFSMTFIDNYCGYLGCVTMLLQTDGVINETTTTTTAPTITSPSVESINEISTIDQQVSSESFQAQFDNCLFMNNSASYGGACYIQNINLLINNSYFIQNKAQLKGGAIYYESTHHQIRIINSEIVNNYAEIAGGVYINDIQFQKTKQLNLFLKNNFATNFSDNLNEAPRKLFISLDKITRFNNINFLTNSTAIIDQVIIEPYQTLGLQNKTDILLLPSGTSISQYVYFDYNKNIYIPYNLSFRIQAYNMLDEQIKGLGDTYCNLEAYIMNKSEQIYQNGDNSSKLISQTIVNFNTNTGDYNLDDLIIKFNPYSDQDLYLQLAMNCNSIQVPYYKSPDDTDSISIITNYKLLLNMRTFQCQLGEYFNDNQTYCTLCDIQQNQFSVTLNATKCNQKDEIKMSEIRSAMINLRKSYWRAFYYSENIELCYHLQANCQGGWLSGNPSCARGHIGALCEQCDLYDVRGEGSFSQSQQYQCSNCEQMAGNLLNIICVVIWTLFSVFVSVNSTNQMIENFIFELKLKPFGYLTILKSASTSVLLKVFTNYLQIISSIASFQLQIPLGITLAFRGVGNPVESMAFSLDCYLIHASNISIIYFRIIWGFIMAGIYIFLFLLFHLTMVLLKKVKINITFLMTTLIYIYIYLSPNLFSGLIALLSYRNISNEKWISANVTYLYDTEQHTNWLFFFVAPALTIIGVLLPFFFWFILFYHRKKLNETKIRKFWGYLYNEYKLVTYYWETVKIIQKELIILVMIYYEDYVPIKAALIFFILYLYNQLTSNYKPYLAGNLNRIDQLSTTICQISIILAQSIYLAQSLDINEIVFPFYAILAIINLLFTSQMISDILFAYFDKLYEQIDKVKHYIYRKLPTIAQQNSYCQKLFQNTTQRKQLIRKRFLKIRQYLVTHARNIIHYKKYYHQYGRNSSFSLRFENTDTDGLSQEQYKIGHLFRKFSFQKSNVNLIQ